MPDLWEHCGAPEIARVVLHNGDRAVVVERHGIVLRRQAWPGIVVRGEDEWAVESPADPSASWAGYG